LPPDRRRLLEQRFSASTTVDCWRSFLLGDISNIFDVLTAQTRFVATHMRPSEAANSGFVGIVEEHNFLGDESARVAFNLHELGNRDKTDLIFIPEGP